MHKGLQIYNSDSRFSLEDCCFIRLNVLISVKFVFFHRYSAKLIPSQIIIIIFFFTVFTFCRGMNFGFLVSGERKKSSRKPQQVQWLLLF